MTSLLKSIEPKSDQLNADDLIGGRTLTVKITKVALSGTEQPIEIHYQGDNGKPYKPCKSMRRVMVNVWGSDGNQYAGRSMTLYRDDKVMFGGVAVGGIRISHMSNIESDVTMALTVARTSRKPFTVKPLVEKTLIERATTFGQHVDKMKSPAALEKLLATNEKLLHDLAHNHPQESAELTAKIEEAKQEIHLAQTTPNPLRGG